MDSVPLKFMAGSVSVEIPLCHKSLKLGRHEVDHYWLDNRLLYGQRNRPSYLHTQIVNIYWEVCREQGALADHDTRQTFLLASLLPNVRSNGSRRVFADARVAGRPARSRERTKDLDLMLRATQENTMQSEEFEAAALRMLRSPDLRADRTIVRRLSEELLSGPSAELLRDRQHAMEQLQLNWERFGRQFGRRGHLPAEKTALDVLSYEARAAFHRCYSVTWLAIKYVLERQQPPISSQTSLFSTLWHLEHGYRSRSFQFRPFHGHIFGLHPAASDLICTPTGRQILGDWLDSPLSQRGIGRVLHAMYIALSGFAQSRDEENSARRSIYRPKEQSPTAISAVARRLPRRPE